MKCAFTALATCAAALAAVLAAHPREASAKPRPAPLYDPVGLNIGLLCKWQWQCMQAQNKAMARALKYVRKKNPPAWRIQACNRNASRKRQRVDWVGYDHCIRNTDLQSAASPVPRIGGPGTRRFA
jgi:hypothetical protein